MKVESYERSMVGGSKENEECLKEIEKKINSRFNPGDGIEKFYDTLCYELGLIPKINKGGKTMTREEFMENHSERMAELEKRIKELEKEDQAIKGN